MQLSASLRMRSRQVDDLLADGVVPTGKVVGGVFLARDQLLGVEELAVGSGADLVDDGRLEVEEDAARDVLARASLGEEGVEGVISGADIGGGLAIGLDSVRLGWGGGVGRREREEGEIERVRSRGKRKNLVRVVCWSSSFFVERGASFFLLFSQSLSPKLLPVLEAVELPAGISDLDACVLLFWRRRG